MKQIIQKIYIVCACSCILLLVFIGFSFRLDVTKDTENENYQTLTNYTQTTVMDSASPSGVRVDYDFQLEDIKEEHCSLVFYTVHQGVRVEVEGNEIYSLTCSEKNLFGKSPGCVWNTIPFTSENSGQKLRVSLYPAYQESINNIPEFYFGGRFYIYRDFILKGAPAMLLSGAAILVGIIFIFFVLYNYKNSEVDKSLMMLGAFSMLVGIWKLTDLSVTNLIFPNYPVLSFVPFVALVLTTIPFTLFIKELYSKPENFLWYIPCVASLINIVLLVVLQLCDIADMRQVLWLNHAIFLLMVVVAIFMTIREAVTVGWSRKLKRNICCMAACFTGLLLDLGLYYFSNGSNYMILGMVGFMLYIVVLGIDSMQEAKQLMTIGMRAKRFDQMAFHDQMTGLYNRTAYAEFIGSEDFDPEHCVVVMCDLNELKKCNDVLGHEKGDVYIKESARQINECFGDIGKCYRMGGDEFCLLIMGGNLEECRRRKSRLQEMVRDFNEKQTDIHMGIACGYELYDKRIDFDINDTSRRADKMMYREKFSMKHSEETA